MVVVHGDVSPGYGAVREAFAENFRTRGEIGAAVAVVVDNQVVVDLWGGSPTRDRDDPGSGTPWSTYSQAPRGCLRSPSPTLTLAGCLSTTSRWPRTGRSSPPTGSAASPYARWSHTRRPVRDRHTDDGGDARRP